MTILPQPHYIWRDEDARVQYEDAVRLAQEIMREAQHHAGVVMKNALRIRDAYTTVTYTLLDVGPT